MSSFVLPWSPGVKVESERSRTFLPVLSASLALEEAELWTEFVSRLVSPAVNVCGLTAAINAAAPRRLMHFERFITKSRLDERNGNRVFTEELLTKLRRSKIQSPKSKVRSRLTLALGVVPQ